MKRLTKSLADWDIRDRKTDWMPEAFAANAMSSSTIFCCSMSPSRSPTKAVSRSRRARSTAGPYRTGGGCTVNANVIDILLTWLVNRDREFLQGGATDATKPGMAMFPYFATANTDVHSGVETVALAAAPDWCGPWPASSISTGIRQLPKCAWPDLKPVRALLMVCIDLSGFA